jgi:S-adenosylmethionine decarboxylase
MEAKIWNKSGWINETDPTKLKNNFSDLLALSNFKILDFMEYYFKPEGYTALWLLGESHFAVHTFPEENKTYIELSSCNEEYFIYFVSNIESLLINC